MQSQSDAAAAPSAPSTSAPSTTPKQTTPLPKGLHRASRKSVALINAWADTLRAGHPDKAASYFAIPSIVQNAGPVIRLRTRKAVLAFNRTLPCGAHVVALEVRAHPGATPLPQEVRGQPGSAA